MESSPLTRAHDHAHAAAAATRQAADTTVAVSEHTLAAGEFANAASRTSSVEALRTLKLLEEHHRRLAELLKLPPAGQATGSTATGDEDEDDADDDGATAGEKQFSEKTGLTEKDDGNGGSREKQQGVAKTSAQTMPSLGSQRRSASREMSSSIASNLASARGIKSKYRGRPLSPSVSNDQAPGSVDAHSRRDGRSKMQNIMDNQQQPQYHHQQHHQQSAGKPGWLPPMPSGHHDERPAKNPTTSPRSDAAAGEDAGYTRFYSTFGSLINKISAPLAFAGLPLIQEETSSAAGLETADATEAPSPTPLPPTSSSSSSSKKAPGSSRLQASATLDPDLSKIYSEATLRALAREGHHGTTAADSFYVVPTSGHTMSYANILSYAEKEKRRLGDGAAGEDNAAGGDEDDDYDDFVDARESPTAHQHSPQASRSRVRQRTQRELANTVEELTMENKSLKDMLDKLTKRLHAFEASAQSSAMALAESYRMMRPGSPASEAAGGGGGSHAQHQQPPKTLDLEQQLAVAIKQAERLERDNRKMQKTLEKYRDKWDMLKAGAKARREAQAGESVEDARQG